MKTLVLAVGNPLRMDDGVGAAIVAILRERDLPSHVTVMDGGTLGFEMVLLFQGYERVVILDAAEMGLEGGVWRHFTPDEVRLQTRDMHLGGTLHYAGLAEALSLGEALGVLPPHIEIFGIQPSKVDWSIGLTPAVAAAVPQVAEAVCAALS